MILRLEVPANGSGFVSFQMMIANASSQELESVLRTETGLGAIFGYDVFNQTVWGYKDGQELSAHYDGGSGKWVLYPVPDAG